MNTPKFVIDRSKNGKWFFNLLAGNGQVIATSEMYESKQACLGGIDSVIASAIRAEIIEKNTFTTKE